MFGQKNIMTTKQFENLNLRDEYLNISSIKKENDKITLVTTLLKFLNILVKHNFNFSDEYKIIDKIIEYLGIKDNNLHLRPHLFQILSIIDPFFFIKNIKKKKK